ncbi:MAG: response regulator [Armatimonadota bacterium]
MAKDTMVDGDGRLRRLAVFAQPPQDETRAGKDLWEREGKYRHLRGDHSGVTLLVQDGVVKYADPQFSAMTGYSHDELIGTSFTRYLAPERRLIESDYTATTDPNHNGRYRHMTQILNRDGYKRSVEITWTPVQYRGHPARLVVITDLSTQRADEIIYETVDIREVGVVAKGIAHDLNNVLQNIMSPAELLISRGPETDEDLKCLEQVVRSCKRGENLVNRLLTFTRQDGPVFRTVYLHNVTDTIEHNLSHSLPDTFHLHIHVPDDIWAINASTEHIAQVLIELCFNAHEAAPEGVTVNITAENVYVADKRSLPHAPHPGAFVVITVTDDAAGMADDTRRQAFEPFFTTKGRPIHSGLGLPLVRDIITMHYGSINCQSAPDEGTKFTIFIPAHVEDDIEFDTRAETQKATVEGGVTVLVVDDDEDICWATRRLLEGEDYQVITASNGVEALEIYQERGSDIDVVILDLVMPKMDGETCLNRLTEIDPDIVVIIASGSLSDSTKRRRLAEKACGYVSKPFEASAFLQTIEQAIQAGR